MLRVVGGEGRFLISRAFLLGVSLLLFSFSAGFSQPAVTNQPPVPGMTLQDVDRRVVDANESIQMKMLDAEISRKTVKAEDGIYEPRGGAGGARRGGRR